MKRLLAVLMFALLALCPLSGLWAQSTTGFHVVSQVLTRASSGVNAQIVPYATVSVTNTGTGGTATIYSDPLLSAQITPAVVTADSGGNYSFYVPLNYCITETITAPGFGTQTIPNVCQNSNSATGVTSINSQAGAFTFSGGGVSCSGTNCVFSSGSACSPNTLANGCTGGTSIPTALQSLNAANGLDTAQAILHPWDDFDAPDGTLVSGRVAPSGQTWACTGGGAATAYISNQAYTGTGNTYCSLADTQIVTEAQEVFSWVPNSTATSFNGATIIFSSCGSVNCGALLHMGLNSTGWELLKSTGGGFNPVGYMASPPVELDGLSIAQVHWGTWLGGNLPMNGAKYRFRAVINSTACTYTAYMPDATTWQWTDPDICTIGPQLNSMIWQVQGPSSSSVNDAVINAVSIGPSKAENVASTNTAAKLETQARLVNKQWSSINGTADGWYTIATGPVESIYPTMGGTVKIYGSDPAERIALFTINVGAQSQAGGVSQSNVTFSITPLLTTAFAGGVVDQVRLSNDATTGNLQLDIHIATPSYPGITLAAEFDGYFVPVTNPVVGVTPLTNWNQILSTAIPSNSTTIPQTLTGGAGWYTVFTSDQLQSQDYTTANFQTSVKNVTYGTEYSNYVVAASVGGCWIWQISSTNQPLIDQVRCSYSNSTAPYVQIDVHDSLSSTYPLTLTNTVTGLGYLINSAPTVGATVLGGGSQTITLAQGSVLTSSLGDWTDSGVANGNVPVWNSSTGKWTPGSGGGVSAFSGGLGASYQDVTEIAAPSNPASGNDRLYLDSTSHQLTCLTTGGGNCMPSGSAGAFSGIGSGTNTAAAMTVGSGASLGTTGTGTISANQLLAVPFCTGFTPTNSQYVQYTTGGTPNPCYSAASPSGSGNTTSTTLTTYYLDEANGANSIISSPFYDANPASTPTKFAGASAILLASDATYTDWISMIGNTTLPSLATHTFNLLAPNSATVTAYGWQFPSATNSAAGIVHVGAESGNVSQLTVSAVALTDFATQGADTFLANMTASTAQPTAVAFPTTIHGVILGAGTAAGPSITAAGAVDTVLLGEGASADPLFGTVTSAYVDSSVVTDASHTTTTAQQVAVSTGTAGGVKFIDYPAPFSVPAANCVSGSGGSAWNTTLVAGCRAGTYNLGGFLPFADSNTGQFQLTLPADWDSSSSSYARLNFTTGANTSGTIIFTVALSCFAANNSATDDQAFQTAQTFSTITAAHANYANSVALTLNSTSLTGCVAGGGMLVKITRSTDTAASIVPVTGATITLPRLLVLQAE